MSTLAWAVGAAAALALICLGDLASEEARTRLNRLPHALIRLAARRAPAQVRADLRDEWTAELEEIQRSAAALPIKRLVIGIWYAAGLLATARNVSRQLAPANRRASLARAIRSAARALNAVVVGGVVLSGLIDRRMRGRQTGPTDREL